METIAEKIRIIIFQDSGQWVAQCLEYDICAQASDIDTLNDRMNVLLKAEIRESIERHGTPFFGVEPAPKRFHQMWERRARSVEVNPAEWVRGNTNLNLALVA
jgi:hypothetical protein